VIWSRKKTQFHDILDLYFKALHDKEGKNMLKVNESAAVKIKESIANTASPDKQMLRISFGGFG